VPEAHLLSPFSEMVVDCHAPTLEPPRTGVKERLIRNRRTTRSKKYRASDGEYMINGSFTSSSALTGRSRWESR
jgi:hypothetical protein